MPLDVRKKKSNKKRVTLPLSVPERLIVLADVPTVADAVDESPATPRQSKYVAAAPTPYMMTVPKPMLSSVRRENNSKISKISRNASIELNEAQRKQIHAREPSMK